VRRRGGLNSSVSSWVNVVVFDFKPVPKREWHSADDVTLANRACIESRHFDTVPKLGAIWCRMKDPNWLAGQTCRVVCYCYLLTVGRRGRARAKITLRSAIAHRFRTAQQCACWCACVHSFALSVCLSVCLSLSVCVCVRVCALRTPAQSALRSTALSFIHSFIYSFIITDS